MVDNTNDSFRKYYPGVHSTSWIKIKDWAIVDKMSICDGFANSNQLIKEKFKDSMEHSANPLWAYGGK